MSVSTPGFLSEIPQAGQNPASAGFDQLRPIEHKPPRRFPALDGLRGIAIFWVFLLHYGGGRRSTNPALQAFGYVCSLGWTGVTLFFLLSGFLITGLLWDSMGQARWFRNFYIRRALRIFPLYYGSLLVLLLWPLFDHSYGFVSTAKIVAVHAFYLQNFPQLEPFWKNEPNPFYMIHYWSLAVEEQFYLLWPLLLATARTLRQAAWLCVFVILGSFAFGMGNLAWAKVPALLGHSPPSHACDLAFGAALAILYRSRHWTSAKRPLKIVGVFGGMLFLISTTPAINPSRHVLLHGALQIMALPAAMAGLLSVMVEGDLSERFARIRWLRWLGVISFGVYIYHWLPAYGYNFLTEKLSGQSFTNKFLAERLVVVAVLTVLISWLSFRFYETPFLRLKDRWAPHQPR